MGRSQVRGGMFCLKKQNLREEERVNKATMVSHTKLDFVDLLFSIDIRQRSAIKRDFNAVHSFHIGLGHVTFFSN